MTIALLADLDQCFDAAGVPYVEVGPSAADPTGASSWRSRTRPPSTGSFSAAGVLCHHTASPAGTSTQSDLHVLLAGNSSAPGPISQLFVSRDAQLFLVAAGRANHGGKGIRPGIDGGCADMNACLLGIEAANNGVGEHWPAAQTELYARTVAALCDWYGWDVDADVYLHATTGPPAGGCNSKIDPAGPWQLEPGCSSTWNVDTWRGYCATFAGGRPAPPAQGDRTVALVVANVADTWAGFLANASWAPNWNGFVISSMVWITGAEKANYLAGGLDEMTITLEQCRGIVLEGPLPQGDQQHEWTGREFKAWLRAA